jgi:hypothetical protein
MTTVVSVLVVAAIIAVGWALIEMASRIMRWAAKTPPLADVRQREPTMPFGSLPPLGPVDQLGGLSPDADVDSDGTNEQDLYGY